MKTIQNICATVGICILLSTAAWGQVALPHYEPFNYTAGKNLGAQAGWASLNTGDSLITVAGNLSYPGFAISSGNKIAFDGAGVDAAKRFDSIATGTAYYSYLLKVTSLGSLGAAGGYFSTFYQSATSTTGGSCVWTRPDGTGFDIGISARINTPISWSSVKSLNTTYLIVASYTFVAGDTNDVCKIWINPDASTFGSSLAPTETLTSKNTGTDLTGVARVQIRQDAAATTPFIEMDELRIGKTWADVTAAGPSTGDYRTNVSVASTWGTATTWETFDGSSWTAATTPPTATANVTILGQDTLTFDPASATVASLSIEDGGILNMIGAKTLNGDVTIHGIFQQTGGAATISMNGNITCSGANAAVKFGSNGGKITNTGVGKNFTLSNGGSFTPATNNGAPPGTGNILSMAVENMAWVIDNTTALTTIIFKNSGNTTILPPPNSQVFGNMKFTTSSGAGPKTINVGADISILGNLSFDPVSSTGYGTGDAVAWIWNLGTYKIRSIGIGRSVTTSQLSNHSLIITGIADTLFPGFSSYNFVPPSNGNCLVNYASVLGAQTVNGGAYQRLAISGGGAKTLSGNITIKDTLSLINGTVTTGAYSVAIGSTGAVARTNGYIIGNLTKNVAVGQTTGTFEIGTAGGYSPVSLTFPNVTAAGTLTTLAIETVHPNATTSANYLKRYWSFVPGSSLAFDTYAATFTYLAGDFNTGVVEATDEAALVVGKYASGWTYPTIGARTAGGVADGGSIQVTGVTSFSDFAIGKNTPTPPVVTFPEDFNYPAGDSLNTIHNWTVQSTASYINTIKVVSPGLSYSGYASVLGNAAQIDTTGQDIYRSFTGNTSGNVYAAFLMNISKATTTGDYFFHFTEAGTTNFRGRVYAKLVGSDIAFGLLKGSAGTAVYTPATYALNTTYLAVLKYKFNTVSATDDSVYLFINPTIGAPEPAPLLSFGSTDADLATVNAINLRQGTAANAPRLVIDGIRIDSTWSGLLPSVSVKAGSATIATKKFSTTVTNTGHIGGLTDFQVPGPGFIFAGSDRLFEGSFLIANSAQNVSNSVRLRAGDWNLGFKPLSDIAFTKVGTTLRTTANYDDSNMPRPLGVNVIQQTVVDTVNSSYLMIRLGVVNTTSAAMTNVLIGSFFDFDMTAAGTDDRGAIIKDSTNTIPGVNGGAPFKMHIAYQQNEGVANYVALVPLNQTVFTAARIVVSPGDIYGTTASPVVLTDTLKYTYLSSFRATNTYTDAGTKADLGIFSSVGPFTLKASGADTANAVFAIVTGSSLAELVANARLVQKDYFNFGFGMKYVTSAGRETAALPMQYVLEQNYPNPFNPSTSIRFAMPQQAQVSLVIYDMLGREVRTLVNNTMNGGLHQVIWDGRNNAGLAVASGVYIYRIRSGNFADVKKMALTK